MFTVLATHPSTPAYSPKSKGRKQHYAETKKQGDLTLCNMLVDRPVSRVVETKLCLTCKKVKAGKIIKMNPLPEVHNPILYTFTINTDASHEPATNISAWAYWIRSSNLLFKDSGLLPDGAPNSSIAELLAFEQAILVVNRSIERAAGLTRNNVKLYVNTDSTFVIQALKGAVKRTKFLKDATRVQALAEGYQLDLRHVKAHVRTDSARTWVNDWLDKNAKFHVRNELRRRQMLKDLEAMNG